jgi:outer membrane protein assembly factor BamB
MIALFLTGAAILAQDPSQVFTRPTVPSREALDRLNLKLAWRIFLPTDGRRDGIFSVQVLPDQIFVQTRSGGIIALDPANGHIQWRVRLGKPYRVTHPLGHNARSVYVADGLQLFALNRSTGRVDWELALPNACSAPPVADAERLYLSLGLNQLYVYGLPDAPRPAAAAKNGGDRPPQALPPPPDSSGAAALSFPGEPPGPRLQLDWDYAADARLDQAPLVTGDLVLAVAADGSAFATSKVRFDPQFRFQADAPLSAPMGQYGETAYLALQNTNLYALDIQTGKFLWRFTSGGQILSKPVVLDEDVFVATDLTGLARFDRATGDPLWRNGEAARFLAANPKFVYAADRSNRLLILDRVRGTRLVVFDTRDFVVPISNDVTDRLFLASHNGLLVCLHDRQYATPLQLRNGSGAKAATDKSETKPPPGQDEGLPREEPKGKDEGMDQEMN